jgi:hypothetical protein
MTEFKFVIIESIGWISNGAFLVSIVVPNRIHLHKLGIFASVTTAIYAYAHGATAIWIRWVIAFFFHSYMIWKMTNVHPGPGPGEA